MAQDNKVTIRGTEYEVNVGVSQTVTLPLINMLGRDDEWKTFDETRLDETQLTDLMERRFDDHRNHAKVAYVLSHLLPDAPKSLVSYRRFTTEEEGRTVEEEKFTLGLSLDEISEIYLLYLDQYKPVKAEIVSDSTIEEVETVERVTEALESYSQKEAPEPLKQELAALRQMVQELQQKNASSTSGQGFAKV